MKILSVGACLFALCSIARAEDQAAVSLLHHALDAQGGEQKLRSLRNIQWQASGYRNALEQSERPEGPYIVEFNTLREIHDIEHQSYRRELGTHIAPLPDYVETTVIADKAAMIVQDGRQMPGSPKHVTLAVQRMALSPESLLLTALDAADCHLKRDEILHGIAHQVVEFTYDGAPVRVFLNAYTHLPTAFDYSGLLARDGYANFLGDATQRTYFSFWQLGERGLHFPMQWNIETNGLPDRILMLHDLRVDSNLDSDLFSVPVAIRGKYLSKSTAVQALNASAVSPAMPANEIAPGVFLIEGPWNATIIEQDDGIIVLEAAISSAYSAKVISEVEKRFPGRAMLGVVSTSDSWPHLAGIREYVARDVPVYALDLNETMLNRVLSTPHTTTPDSLQAHTHAPRFQFVHNKLTIGQGKNRMELYPLRGMTSERQLMVYFPQHRLLYGSDAFQRMEDGSFFMPQGVSEVVDAAKREHLDIKNFFMMHIGITPWSEISKLGAKFW